MLAGVEQIIATLLWLQRTRILKFIAYFFLGNYYINKIQVLYARILQ
jgi:hypothetical protein